MNQNRCNLSTRLEAKVPNLITQDSVSLLMSQDHNVESTLNQTQRSTEDPNFNKTADMKYLNLDFAKFKSTISKSKIQFCHSADKYANIKLKNVIKGKLLIIN